MQQILHIRNTTGIGQAGLAGLLGISRQALAKAEKGMCSLSTENVLRLSRLSNCLEKTAAAKLQTEIGPAILEACSKREAACRYGAARLQKMLKTCEATHHESMRLQQALEQLEPVDEAEKTWIQKTKKDIIKKLEQCGTATCIRLRKQIYLLIAEADYISRFVNENQ